MAKFGFARGELGKQSLIQKNFGAVVDMQNKRSSGDRNHGVVVKLSWYPEAYCDVMFWLLLDDFVK